MKRHDNSKNENRAQVQRDIRDGRRMSRDMSGTSGVGLPGTFCQVSGAG